MYLLEMEASTVRLNRDKVERLRESSKDSRLGEVLREISLDDSDSLKPCTFGTLSAHR